ncbi:MAG: hypothetical protein JSW73_01665 [Candidatus Woesearchaeota archaeon]|nr:MAG: hypothetical protein JSW73_01665 [Candidatus Woesearchaeota archaeon]
MAKTKSLVKILKKEGKSNRTVRVVKTIENLMPMNHICYNKEDFSNNEVTLRLGEFVEGVKNLMPNYNPLIPGWNPYKN